MKLTGPLAIVLVALAALGLASGAAAKPGRARYEPPAASFTVPGTNGFQVSFDVSQELLLADAHSGPYDVAYVVGHTEAQGDRFTGRLPGIGAVSVGFHQRGPVERQATACTKSPPILTRKGVFTGTVRLRGERGYTRVDATHARGSVTQDPEQLCTRLRPAKGPGLAHRSTRSTETPILQLLAKAPNILVQAFQIGSGDEPGLSLASASRLRHYGGMSVSSSARKMTRHPSLMGLGETAFPESATLAPGRPFTGSAAFALHGPRSSTWTGDLAVTLPGVGPVRLAGAQFKSTICRNEDCRGSLPFQISSSDSEGYVGYGPKTRLGAS